MPRIDLKIAKEPWRYDMFWRIVIFSTLFLWVLDYTFHIWFGYEYYNHLIRKWGWFDKKCEIFEKYNHIKDYSYFLFYDHSICFVILLAQPLLIPPVLGSMMYKNSGIGGYRIMFTFDDKKEGFALARWRMKTYISIYENIPQVILIFCELFIKGKTVTVIQVFFAISSIIWAVRHLGRVTGESIV